MFLEILFDILSFSATTWQFFVTLSDSLRCVFILGSSHDPHLDEVFFSYVSVLCTSADPLSV